MKKPYTKRDMAAVSYNPEITAERLKAAKPFAEVFPDLAATIKRGRPRLEKPKQQVTLRLDADLIAALRASGPGWSGRVESVLASSIKAGRFAPARRIARKRA